MKKKKAISNDKSFYIKKIRKATRQLKQLQSVLISLYGRNESHRLVIGVIDFILRDLQKK